MSEPKGRVRVWTDERGACDERGGKTPTAGAPEASRASRVSGASTVTLTVNGQRRRARVEPRRTLADLLRQELGLTGTHLACEHGVCGSCTVLVDGEAVRSCLMFGVQADGSEVTTVEGLAGDEPGSLGPVQRAFWETHGP